MRVTGRGTYKVDSRAEGEHDKRRSPLKTRSDSVVRTRGICEETEDKMSQDNTYMATGERVQYHD
jgi:hypothetical protein